MSEDSETLAELIEQLNDDELLLVSVEPDDLWKWKLYGAWPCYKCLYNLQGLQGPKIICPECGGINDLRNQELWMKTASPEAVGRVIDVSYAATSIFSIGMFIAALSNAIQQAWGRVVLCTIICVFASWIWIRQIKRWLELIRSKTLGCSLVFAAHVSLYLMLSFAGVALYEYLGWHVLWFLFPMTAGFVLYEYIQYKLKRVVENREHTMTWVCWSIDAFVNDA